VDGRHFDRWLLLFRETAIEVSPSIAAAHFIERADRIAESLELGIAGKNGILLMKGQRLRRPDTEVYLKGKDEIQQDRVRRTSRSDN